MNPFVDSATANLYIENDDTVSLSLYNAVGNEIEILLKDTFLTSGNYAFIFGRQLTNGVYILLLEKDSTKLLKKAARFNSASTNPILFSNNQLLHLYPNPASNTITVEWSVELNKTYQLDVYDIIGALVYSNVIKTNNNGKYSEELNMNNYASGVYTVCISAAGFTQNAKMVLMK